MAQPQPTMSFDLCETFSTERKILSFSGFYPTKTGKTLMYNLSAFFNLFVSYGQFFATIAQMIADRNDLSKLTDDLLYFITHFTFLCKLANFSYCKDKILEMEDLLKDQVLNEFREGQLKKLKDRIEGCVFFGKIFRALCVFGVIFYSLEPFIDPAKKMSLPVPGWYPYNMTKYYFETTGFQVVSLCITANTNSTIDIMTWILITLSCAQFEILQENLRDIRYDPSGKKTSAESDLKKCIDRHRGVMTWTYKVQDIFSKGIFLQFFASLVAICVTCFQVVVVPVFSSRFVFLISYFFCMILQVTMYCWYGNDIMLTSSEINQSFYISNWYESDVTVRKIMLIFLERTKRPVILSAGNFIPLSLPTLIAILRMSYSYFAVLQHLYKEE